MALKLEQIQSTVCDIIKSAASFQNAEHIFADDGTKQEEMEDALKSVGWCVVVSPPFGIGTKDHASGSALLNVLTVVSLRTNPKRNTGPQAKNVFVCVGDIIKAALAWKSAPGERGFALTPDRPFEPDFEDVGCFTYDIRLLKGVSL